VQLWAWYAAYDHVGLPRRWGAMPQLPRVLPRFTRASRQRWEDLGKPDLPAPPENAHDALADARHNLARWKRMEEVRSRRGLGICRSGRRQAAESSELHDRPSHQVRPILLRRIRQSGQLCLG